VTPEFPAFRCPVCKGALDLKADQYGCAPCRKSYPIVLGIPDFRIFPDPYIDYQDDYRKGEYLVEHSADLDFEGMVRLYWKITPHVEEDRAARFIRNAVALADKGKARLREIERLSAENGGPHGGFGSQAALEIGCGTGGFLVAAAGKFQHVVGVDIAFRWLVVAKKRLAEAGLNLPLVCACAEYLPFSPDTFDLIVAEDVLDHVRDQASTLDECHRVATPRGALFLATPNRFSLTPEPHVRVWGVGFLPRRWMSRYVQLIKGFPYEHIKVLSFPALNRLLRRSLFRRRHILLPSVSPEEVQTLSPFERRLTAIYGAVKKTPPGRAILYLFGPFFHALCYADKPTAHRDEEGDHSASRGARR
jgi:ubiquinone/menaquinone biosynthesis C-methylase UbiE